jgi:hypothetical protein
MSNTVKAVGFAYCSPEVILLFSDHARQQLHVYPPKDPNEQLKFANDGRKHMLLLLSPDALSRLDEKAWRKRIHRVLLFGKLEDLKALEVPVLDALRDEDGKVMPNRRQTRDELLSRIEQEAVAVQLDTHLGAQRRAKRRAEETAAYDGPTFKSFLKDLRGAITADAASFTFADDVGVPAVMRLMQDTSQADFKEACVRMIDVGGLPEDKVKSLFKWVEGIDGIGPELCRAVEAYLYPENPDAEIDLADLAGRYNVSAEDVQSVSNVYKKLQALD